GTPAYMAPEQAAGDTDIDQRADLYAWGVLAYECLTHAHPFADKKTARALITAHLVAQPTPIGERVDVGGAVADIVMRCLAKDPHARPRSARALLAALDAPGEAVAAAPQLNVPSIAILPFVNMSADAENEYFSDGITEELLNALTKVDGLQVTSRTSAFAFKGKNTDIREIGIQLNVDRILEGSVRKAGNRVRITEQLINV